MTISFFWAFWQNSALKAFGLAGRVQGDSLGKKEPVTLKGLGGWRSLVFSFEEEYQTDRARVHIRGLLL